MDFGGLLDSVVKTGNTMYDVFNTFCGAMFVPISETSFGQIFAGIDNAAPFLTFTMAEVLLGGGLSLFIGYTLVKWVLDIIF